MGRGLQGEDRTVHLGQTVPGHILHRGFTAHRAGPVSIPGVVVHGESGGTAEHQGLKYP